MPFSSEGASIHTIPNPFNPADFGALNFQFQVLRNIYQGNRGDVEKGFNVWV